jgi:hypothetical protein
MIGSNMHIIDDQKSWNVIQVTAEKIHVDIKQRNE